MKTLLLTILIACLSGCASINYCSPDRQTFDLQPGQTIKNSIIGKTTVKQCLPRNQGIQICVNDQGDLSTAEHMQERMPNILSGLKETLGAYPGNVNILLFEMKDKIYSGGFYDGVENLIIVGSNATSDAVLAHELTHSMFCNTRHTGEPNWINESLAQAGAIGVEMRNNQINISQDYEWLNTAIEYADSSKGLKFVFDTTDIYKDPTVSGNYIPRAGYRRLSGIGALILQQRDANKPVKSIIETLATASNKQLIPDLTGKSNQEFKDIFLNKYSDNLPK